MQQQQQQRNPRLILAGSVLFVLAVMFFVFMLSIASRSNDPAALMQTVGSVSGICTGLAVAMIVFGRYGKAKMKA